MTAEPIERTPKGKVSPPGPAVISWSGLKRWEHCPQHHYRVIRKETERSQMGRVFLPGTVCDLVQRRWLESEDPQPGQMVEMVAQVFSEVVAEGESVIKWRGNPVTDQQDVQAYCREAVQTLEPWLVRNVLPYDYQPEVRFRAHMKVPYVCEGEKSYGIVRMIGGIDIVVRDDAGKFRLYDLAWGVIQGDFYHANQWGFVTPALPEPYIPITVDREDRAAMLSRIVKYAQGVWREEWTPKPDDDGCNWCEARGACEKFRDIAIVDENGKQRLSFMQAAEQRKQFRA